MRQDKTINKYINKRNSNWASLSVEKSSYFLIIGIHPFSYNCAQEKKKKKTLSMKRYALSLKLVDKIRKARWKIKQLSRHLPDIENSLNKHLQYPS